MRVHKFPTYVGLFRSLLPHTAEILHFGPDPEGGFSIWALVSPLDVQYARRSADEARFSRLDTPELRYFFLATTGEELPPYATTDAYVGTAQHRGFVAHLFEHKWE
tara:strand:- start:242 stop:559 length:318 start_codon:yes stop_codon:yes gene_type:complete